MPQSKRVILGVTGSIAAYKAADIIRRLQDEGCRVSVVMTREAEKFISALTFSSLSGEPAFRDMFEEHTGAWSMQHIALAKEADLLLIAPATANTIGKLANGLADDLLSCLALATSAPIMIAPAMNDEMFRNKMVQANCHKLQAAGVHFVNPVKGKLACGVFGEGHLADVNDIVKAALRLLE